MREDMHKKVIEGSRWASAWARNGSVKHERQRLLQARAGGLDWDDLSARITSTPRRGCRRGQTDTLNPLRRFLLSRLGQPWDQVYSELRENLSPSSVIHLHIFQHLDHMVARDVVLDGDRVFVLHSHQRELFDREGWRLYVHPETGRLCRPTRRWQRPRPDALPPLPRIEQEEGRILLYVEGLWYGVQTVPWDVFSHAEGRTIPHEVRVARYGDAYRLAAEKRVISRREKRRAGLL